MNKILVVFTGGTIGSSVTGDTIDTAAENQFRLLEMYKQRFARAAQVVFIPISPVEMLSENLVPAVWTEVITAIDAVDPQSLTGIIITHGTDTLAFSACAFSFYYAGINLPLVMVSSDYPLSDARANGLDNFDAAVTLILDYKMRGVFVAYRNQGQSMQIHLGTRLASCLQLSGDFMSVQSKAYLQFVDNQFNVLHEPSLPTHPWSLQPHFSSRVALIKPYPGLNYTGINLQNIDAVLHDLYHSGTACVTPAWGDEYSLISFIKRCKQSGVKVYLAPGVSSPNHYSSTDEMLAQDAEMLWDMSLEAAYVKLLLAYANFDDIAVRKTFLQQNIAHEILELNYI